MDRYQPRAGTGLMAFEHIAWMQDGIQRTLTDAFADYMAVTDSFFVQGGEITETPSGSGVEYTIADGVVCLAGEFMPLVGSTALKSAAQVVYLSIQDNGVDDYPVPNLDGQVDHVMRERKAIMQVGLTMPVGSFALNLARKAEIDMLRLKGRVVPKGGILPYFGAMTIFDATGLGLTGTPAEGWAVCNGLNGTVDMRGLVPLGATNVPSSGAGSLYAGVAEGTTNAGDAVGSDGVVINASNLPPHKHPYNDDNRELSVTGGGLASGSGYVANTVSPSKNTGDNSTTNDPISVRQASRTLVFIQSII